IALPPLITALTGKRRKLRVDAEMPRRARLFLEAGGTRDISPHEVDGGVELPAIAEIGYHRLEIGDREIVLAVAPPRATAISEIARGRLWGLVAQVYGLRRTGDGGIGDLAGVAALAECAAGYGADAIALSPLHAMFAAMPDRYGPYSPSSRLFLNPLYAAPSLVFGDAIVARVSARNGVAAEFTRLELLNQVDWPASATTKLALFGDLFRWFLDGLDVPDALRVDFARFQADGAASLARHATFEALSAEQLAIDPRRRDWHDWPLDLRDPDSAAVAAFARAHRHGVQFHVFLQWITARSLAATQHRARAAGMRIGIVADMAVGIDPAGSHAWSLPDGILKNAAVGAPPDLFNPNGQQWGITTFAPQSLVRTGFAPFIATVRATLRHTGGVRIDHAMGLQRLWLVPAGNSPAEGAYLEYPLTDMLRLLALESHRHHAVVIGEDLGTVPDGLRDTLAAYGLYGMRVLWFERSDGAFLQPADWDANAVAMTSTHDLPPLASWWTGADIALRDRHHVLAPWQRREQLETERQADRIAIRQTFAGPASTKEEPPTPDDTQRFVDDALQFVASTAAPLALLPLEDVLGTTEQPNLPGTTDQHPNWKRRLNGPVEEILNDAPAAQRLRLIAAERPRQ
ncbi:MAG: 4-alpha-glucanotransferase, partial [Acetobacteraceae bacterium]